MITSSSQNATFAHCISPLRSRPCVFGGEWFQDGDVGIGVFPEGEPKHRMPMPATPIASPEPTRPGRIMLGRFDLHIAGVIVAILFCLSHVASFWTESFSAAAGQQVYAFVWGVIYAYWLEKSGSLLPSIIGHNLGNLIEDILAFAMAWHWS
jgi:hypothetical protein